MATESLTVSNLLEYNATQHPDKVAVIIPDGPQWTYTNLKKQVDTLKKILLASGISPGDVLSMVLPNSLSFLALFFAITGVRAVSSPLNPAYKLDDFLFYLKDINAKVLLLPAGTQESEDSLKAANQLKIPIWYVREDGEQIKLETGVTWVEVSATSPDQEDIALVLHTSGTTSLPKGVPLTHLNLTISAINIANTYDLSPSDTTLVVMPLFHVHGLVGATLSTLQTGGTVVLPPRFSASTFWNNIDVYNVTWYSAVPTIHQILLLRAESDNVPKDKLRFIRSCSASLAPTTYDQLRERFGVPVLEAYGMTEASHQMASNPLPIRGVAKVNSVGKPTNVEVSIRHMTEDVALPIGETGEVCIQGKNVTKGYWNRPEANKSSFTETGWFRTGDLGHMDSEGYIVLTSRIKELINRGGEKISPVEIDAVLISHPKVKDAVSFGVPDEKYGEQVNCAVILKEGQTATSNDITKFVGEKLSNFKVPTKVFFCDEFPRTATGKIQRKVIADHFLGKKDKQ